jgi:Glycosyl transferase family 2
MKAQDTPSACFARVHELLSAGQLHQASAALSALDPTRLSATAAQIHELLVRRVQAALAAAGGEAMHRVEAPQAATVLVADAAEPLAGTSIVSACMNREANLLKVLPTWLDAPVQEIVIVDWSSREPLAPKLAHLRDPRLRVVRVDDEPRWVLTLAFNLGLRLARHERVYKLDADIELKPGFLDQNQFGPGEFIRGYWRSAVEAGQDDQRYVNGSFGAWKTDLRAVGYYDERIQTYGWDDTDLYRRLSGVRGLAGRLLRFGSLTHLAQEETQRLENQAVQKQLLLDRFAPTEVENQVNRFFSQTMSEWGSYSPGQDYSLAPEGEGSLRAQRASHHAVELAIERNLGRVLAARSLASWAVWELRPLDAALIQSVDFGHLVAQLHATERSSQLLQVLRGERALHLIRASAGAWRSAGLATLELLLGHHGTNDGPLVVIEDNALLMEPLRDGQRVLRASLRVMDELERALGPRECDDLSMLDDILADPRGPCTRWRLDAGLLATAAQRKAQELVLRLPGQWPGEAKATLGTVFISSVYDDANLLRLSEYLSCVVLNARVFERVVLMYEARDGLFALSLQQLVADGAINARSVQLAPFKARPNFEQLFGLAAGYPAGTLLVAGNADIFFDHSLAALAGSLAQGTVCALSRRDIAADGRSAKLIRLENGCPNTFSADAWVARTPFEPDFFLDYPIGSFHCDSFINHQFSRSRRYRPANPCLDVHVFHLHDERFNSSQAKWLRERAQIEARRVEEQSRNGGDEPLKGLSWCRLADIDLLGRPESALTWRPRAIVLERGHVPFSLGDLFMLHALAEAMRPHWDVVVVVRLQREQIDSPVMRLLALLKSHFGHWTLLFDEAESFEPPPDPRVRRIELGTLELADVLVQAGLPAVGSLVQAKAGWLEHDQHDKVVGTFRESLSDVDALHVLRQIQARQPDLFDALATWLDGIDTWSAEGRLVRPIWRSLRTGARSPAVPAAGPAVSFVTSMFRGGEFVSGYLSNVLAAAIEADGEVILVDANQGDHDAPAVEAFLARHEQARRRIRWIRPERDPGLYACWRLGIEQARAPFITNANLDDRRSPDHTRRIVELLQWRGDLSAASGRISAVRGLAAGGWFDLVPNELWFEDLEACEFGHEALFIRDPDGTIRSRNVLHCMPVWRRDLHDRHGWFDEERYGTSADWAFWLAVGRAGGRFAFVPEAYGRYLINLQSHNRRNDADGIKERRIIAELIGVQQGHVIKQ